jgi:hypothetical protein
MNDRTQFKKLLESFEIKKVKLKNRMVKAPYSSTNADKDGYVIDSAVYHYESVARGGIGMFITESAAIDPLGVSGCPRMAIYNDSYKSVDDILAKETISKHASVTIHQKRSGLSWENCDEEKKLNFHRNRFIIIFEGNGGGKS